MIESDSTCYVVIADVIDSMLSHEMNTLDIYRYVICVRRSR